MLRPVDEFDLRRMRETGGLYAFYLRAMRRRTVGLSATGPFDDVVLEAARHKCLTILDRVLDLLATPYEGSLRELNAYPAHGTRVELHGSLAYSRHLQEVVSRIDVADVPAFVKTVETLATSLPPLYVGITTRQSLQTRYSQHKTDHAQRNPGTFGQRLATSGFSWADVIFTCAPQATLRMSRESVRALETYLHFMTRPRLGRA